MTAVFPTQELSPSDPDWFLRMDRFRVDSLSRAQLAMLLDRTPTDLNSEHPTMGGTLLTWAAEHHRDDLIGLLLERGADPLKASKVENMDALQWATATQGAEERRAATIALLSSNRRGRGGAVELLPSLKDHRPAEDLEQHNRLSCSLVGDAEEGGVAAGAAEVRSSFEAAPAFQGSRPGYIFKLGDRGQGYYSDADPSTTVPKYSPPPEDEQHTWVACNHCGKWRRIIVDTDDSPPAENVPWTCSMNIADPERNTCDADEEAHRHGPQHVSVAAEPIGMGDAVLGAVYWLVLCPIFGVLSCTVWKGTTAGTWVLIIAIFLYAYSAACTLCHPAMRLDLDTKALSKSELDALVAEVNEARVGVCVHVRCTHSFWKQFTVEVSDGDGGTTTQYEERLVTEVSFDQTDIFKYGECAVDPQNPSSVDMGDFGMCVVRLNVACDTDALTLGLNEAKEKAISDNRHRDQDCGAVHCCLLLSLWGVTLGVGSNKKLISWIDGNDRESGKLFICSDAQKRRIQRMKPWVLLSICTGTIGLLYLWFVDFSTGDVELNFKKVLLPCGPSQNQQTQELSQEAASKVWKDVDKYGLKWDEVKGLPPGFVEKMEYSNEASVAVRQAFSKACKADGTWHQTADDWAERLRLLRIFIESEAGKAVVAEAPSEAATTNASPSAPPPDENEDNFGCDGEDEEELEAMRNMMDELDESKGVSVSVPVV